ncbi:Copper-exporting P-type ATPase A [Anoxybacillus sp. BCO1]|nr:Copper-exporting P-type ATPase A [Anoxybacillus sp. BCO1]
MRTVTLKVTGMTCAACSARIEKVLNKMDGVEATVNLTMEKATVQYDPNKYTIADIEAKIEKLGYGVATEKVTLDIEGMTCAACATRIEKRVASAGGCDKRYGKLGDKQCGGRI